MINNVEETCLIAVSAQNTEYEFCIRNNYEFMFRNKKTKVDIIEEADGFTILSFNGLRYPIEIVSVQQNAFEVLINGVGYSFSVETPFSLKRKKILSASETVSKSELIKSPMPGKILEILVSEGQSVNRGEPLLILEAMKMQNTIVAAAKSIVTKVAIRSGATVSKDDLLVHLDRIN